MDDKELKAIVSCHEALKDLSNDSKKRIFNYLTDRYSLSETIVSAQNSGVSNAGKTSNKATLKEQDSTKKEGKTNNSRRKTTTSSESYNRVDLDLIPNGKESLKDFFAKYKVNNNFERNIVILYYLKRKLELENVGVNHIYTCYKHLSLKVPLLGQSLRDTKNRKGWIDTSNSDDLKVTREGENFIDHEIETAE
jgi:hypothetical protein